MKSTTTSKNHWENIYDNKRDEEVSWYQEVPTASLNLISSLKLNRDVAIIDIGGGNSTLSGKLLDIGFINLSILDISANALERTKTKLKEKAANVLWFVSDILDFQPDKVYDLWHDRATFHFLTKEEDILRYIDIVSHSLKSGAYFILGTFSISGPKNCSGLDVMQYSSDTLKELFSKNFVQLKSFDSIHKTPFETEQDFIFSLFQKI